MNNNTANHYKPLQLTEFTFRLQVAPFPHWVDEGPLILYPRAHEKEQVDPERWLDERQWEGDTRTPLLGVSFLHFAENNETTSVRNVWDEGIQNLKINRFTGRCLSFFFNNSWTNYCKVKSC